jgi:hypothetical protein
LEAAEPPQDDALEAVATALTQPEYVYLFLIVEGEQDAEPKAKIPAKEFPAAEPNLLVAEDAVEEAFTSPE